MPNRHTASEQDTWLFADEDPGIGQLERWAHAHGYEKIAGVDEVGRGPLAGPVLAAAVILGDVENLGGLNDSKKLSRIKRESFARQISEHALAVGLGVVGPARIDETNIRLASLEAMSLALAQVLEQGHVPDVVLVDGRDVFELLEGAPSMVVKAFIKGDARSRAIAAASIVAKVYRDALMKEYHSIWPEYGFDKHAGYPTKAHRQALLEHGPCEIHRRSFKGVTSRE